MRFFRLQVLLLIGLATFSTVDAQKNVGSAKKHISVGIVNGKANYLPKPIYSKEAEIHCANGKVEIEVLIGEDGKVITAKAISGDELLQESSEAAAKKATFIQTNDVPAVRVLGRLIYNFDHLAKCIDAGIVNKKALSIPKPVGVGNILHPSHLRLSEDAIINVTIVIDEKGDVLSARASSGHPLLRNAFERSASGAKFYPTLIDTGPLKIKAILSYRLKPNGEMEY